MIEIPQSLKRLAIKEKFSPSKKMMAELRSLEYKKEVKDLLSKIEKVIDVNFTDNEPEINLDTNSISIGWFGSLDSKFVRVDLIWEYHTGEMRNYILATDEGGEEEVLEEL